MNTYKLKLYDMGGNVTETEEVLSFKFTTDILSSSTALGCLVTGVEDAVYVRADFYVDSFFIHSGYIRQQKFSENLSIKKLSLSSYGFSHLMQENFFTPGLYPAISLNSLMENYVTLPNVSHEDNSDTSNYIYIEDRRTMWDAVTNLSYKLKGNLPFITNRNKVNITIPSSPSQLNLTDAVVRERGTVKNTNDLFSELHMQDAGGSYDVYSFYDPAAADYGIVRRKELPLDMEYLNSPTDALTFRYYKSHLGLKRGYLAVTDYYDLPLWGNIRYDSVIYRVCRIEVMGDSGGAVTKYFYNL